MKELINVLSTKVEDIAKSISDLLRISMLHNDVLRKYEERLQKLEADRGETNKDILGDVPEL